ncbi:MAG: leucine-rich repeat domain-containing protein [Planctomycetota bacterium]|jgi:hypothetical protein
MIRFNMNTRALTVALGLACIVLADPVDAQLPLRQVTQEEVHAALAKDNPGYNGKAQFGEDKGFIVAVSLSQCPNVKNIQAVSFLPLKALDLMNTQVADLTPVKTLKSLQELYIEQTQVVSLKPLKGLPIQKLYLSNTPVTSLDGLEGMPLIEMNAVGTKISDISGLKGAPLQMLWLNDAPVSDVSALAESKTMQSLTLKGTNIKDLSFVKTMSGLQRLHIGETKVTDLTPLKAVPLTRLVFTPSRIKKGIMDVRRLSTMQQIGVEFSDSPDSLMTPIVFWEKYDKGEFK